MFRVALEGEGGVCAVDEFAYHVSKCRIVGGINNSREPEGKVTSLEQHLLKLGSNKELSFIKDIECEVREDAVDRCRVHTFHKQGKTGLVLPYFLDVHVF